MFPIIQKPAGTLDPVCGMTVDPERAAASSVYRGRTYHFCSEGCAQRFQANPEKYLHPDRAPDPIEVAPGTAEYTCPMHPEVRRPGPGACPKCGMALEPLAFSLASSDEADPEYADMRRRFWLSLPLAAILLALMYARVHSPWAELALATPVVLWAGWPLFARGWASIVNRR
jgi:Cu+-exporting ATPase